MDNKDISTEQKHLDQTVRKIKDYKYFLSEIMDRKEKQMRSQSDMTGDIETYKSSKHYKQLMSSALKEPFFGSIELESREEGFEKFYIGKHGVYDKDHNMIVIDWRRPISTVWYNFTPGEPKQKYEVEINGNEKVTYEVDVKKKKEFEIQDLRIKKILQQVSDLNSESNITITEQGETMTIRDDFLRNIVENQESTGYLKDIVATIQREQDKAIREPLQKNLIVQGVAGSGKSSIALHRLSYLLYNNKLVKPEDTLILGPSKMFISSVKDLLPELEIEHVEQKTVTDLMLDILNKDVKDLDSSIASYFEETLFSYESNEKYKKLVEFKGSKNIIDLIDRFLEAYKESYVNRLSPITIYGYTLTKDDLKEIYGGYKYLSFYDRAEKFKDHVKNHFLEKKKAEIEEVDNSYKSVKRFFEEKSGLGKVEFNTSIEIASKVKQNKIASIEKEYKLEITKWQRKLTTDNVLSLYKRLLTKEIIEQVTVDSNIIGLLSDYSLNKVDYFDIAPLCYMYMSLYDDYKKYVHLVIDEGQDLSYAHYLVLKKLTKTMTILGDKDQSIFMNYGQSDWDALARVIFNKREVTKLSLDTSYRSTKEIIDVANQVLTNNLEIQQNLITPLNRSGNKVGITKVKDGKELADNIIQLLRAWKEKYKRIAVIHKTEDKSKVFTNLLKNEFGTDIAFIDPEQDIQNNNISVLTSYNSKGMEFDAVILVNINEESFPNDALHSRLLYVLVTRAQHELQMFYNEKVSPLLEGIIENWPEQEESIYDRIL